MTSFWEQFLLPCRLADCEFPIVNLDDMEKLGVVAHEYPFRPGADLEHVGRGAARFKVVGAFFRQLDGYTTALYPGTYETLRARLRQNPLVTMTHPTLGILEVGVEQMDTSRDPEKRDGEFLTLTIVEKGHASVLGDGLGQVPDLEQSLLAHARVVPTIPGDPDLDFFDVISSIVDAARGIVRRADDVVALGNTYVSVVTDGIDGLGSAANDLVTSAVEINQRIEAIVEDVRAARDTAAGVESGDRVRGCSLLLDDLATWQRSLMEDGAETVAYVVPAPTDLWQLSLSLYGDTSRVGAIEAMNPQLSAVFLDAGTRLTVPSPKGYARGAA